MDNIIMAINRLQCGNTAHSCKAWYIKLAIEALEKQIPKKIECVEDKHMFCPICGEILCYKWEKYSDKLNTHLFEEFKYCWNCGHRLDWSEYDRKNT